MKKSILAILRPALGDPAVTLFGLVFGLMFISFFPGIVSFDASSQLAQALAHRFEDWHSPLMSWLWSGFNRVYVGPALYLLFDQAVAFLALWLILRTTFSSWQGRFWALVAIVFLPPNFVLLGTVSKEGVFCPALLLALGLLCHSYSPFRRRPAVYLAASGLLVFLAVGTRPEGIAPAFPLVFWMFWPRSGRPMQSQIKLRCLAAAAALSLLACAACVTAAQAVNTRIAQGRHSYPEQVILDHDLAAISVATGHLLFPATSLTSHGSLAQVSAAYDPADSMPLTWSADPPLRQLAGSEREFGNLRRNWAEAVAHHPLLYLAHRAIMFFHFLGFGQEPGNHSLDFAPWENPPEFFRSSHAHFSPSVIVRAEGQLYRHLDRAGLFRPAPFVAIDCFVIWALGRAGRWSAVGSQLALILAISGLLHLAIFFFVVPVSMPRYAHWLMLSASVGLVLCAQVLASPADGSRPERA